MNTREKLGDLVVSQIKADIAKGTYKINEKILAEPELMKVYGVGRSTIREAVKTLATSGILKVQQGFGTIVNSAVAEQTIDQRLKNADFDEINAVRKLLETEIVKLATENHSLTYITEMNNVWRTGGLQFYPKTMAHVWRLISLFTSLLLRHRSTQFWPIFIKALP